MSAVGLGLRVKLGWAVAIAVDVDPSSDAVARVVARSEPRLDRSGGIFGYHAAMEAEPEARASIVAEAAERAADAATDALADAVDEVEASGGAEVVAVGIVVGRGVRRIPLERILASSQLFHTAEAEVIQDGFAEAAHRLGLPVVRVTFADAEADESWPHVDGLAKAAGRPWRKDQKLAAVAAWRALRGAASSF